MNFGQKGVSDILPNHVGLENIYFFQKYQVNIIMKPTNSPTQGQPNPRQIWVKMATGPLFFYFFSGLGLVFTQETDKKPNPIQLSANTLVIRPHDGPKHHVLRSIPSCLHPRFVFSFTMVSAIAKVASIVSGFLV